MIRMSRKRTSFLWKKKKPASDSFPFFSLIILNINSFHTQIAGTATHSLDYRKSAGAFIHGFRYTGKEAVWSVMDS